MRCATPGDGVSTEPQVSTDQLVAWGHTLSESLLPLRIRARFEDSLARAQRENPDMVHQFLAGVLSDMVLTLPARDRWRTLSGRIGSTSCGPMPPQADGAQDSESGAFGTWRDAVDLTPLVYASPYDDPQLVALAGDDLHPHAAAILASGAQGWETALAMIEAAYAAGPGPTGGGKIVDLSTRAAPSCARVCLQRDPVGRSSAPGVYGA